MKRGAAGKSQIQRDLGLLTQLGRQRLLGLVLLGIHGLLDELRSHFFERW